MRRFPVFWAVLCAALFLALPPVAAQGFPEGFPVEEEATDLPLSDVGDAGAEVSGFHQVLKKKFIEGSAFFMSWIAAAFVIGLAFCIERIIYLSLAEVDTKRFTASVERALEEGDVDRAKDIARGTRGPVACYLERGCSWITLFIAMAPSLGFLGTVIGMVQAFDNIQQVGDISPAVVAGGMKVALITTIFGLIVALILQLFYNYVLSKIEALTQEMEDSSVTLLDMVIKYDLRYGR